MKDQAALKQIHTIIQAIYGCQGWQKALQSTDPGNLTNWLGPRLSYIEQIARRQAKATKREVTS